MLRMIRVLYSRIRNVLISMRLIKKARKSLLNFVTLFVLFPDGFIELFFGNNKKQWS